MLNGVVHLAYEERPDDMLSLVVIEPRGRRISVHTAQEAQQPGWWAIRHCEGRQFFRV
jgi:hypothetical protein